MKKNSSSDAIIYTYTLLRRIPHHLLLLGVYYAFAAVWAVKALLTGSLLSLCLGYVFVQLLHMLAIRGYLHFVRKAEPQGWSFRFAHLWTGYIPAQYVMLRSFVRLHLHLLISGFAGILLLYPWFSAAALSNILFVHLWILGGRFYMFLMFRKQYQVGWLRLRANETSCYKQ
ncbi:hypothetical protein ACI48J_25585 [Paenibacillus chitinolyticus]|uniref:hypothetical protein n=1 Tax=Paenibacillus chitinolyticus TaxID=79263 RepID=UPI002DBDDE17|nr:hypothetical protein [Paenibacillus chitinolyticus]MEC0248353.1 hypothetical protein [Paenibacillus chitinolyticus]